MSLKYSGVEWIGKIPSHWEISKIKYQTYINKQTLSDQTAEDYIIQYIDIGNVNSEGEIQELQEYKFSDAPSRARRIVKKNDLLISTVRTYLKAITSILDDVEDNMICSTGFAVLTPRETMDPLYLHYLSRSEMYIDEIVSRSTGVSYPAINASDIGTLECILPPLDEQQIIGKFLYEKFSEVESIIQSKLKYMELLEQQRQSIITEAVTKGLNPNVKMKDSGVEWIGEIPEHWEEKKIKYLFYEANERNFNEDATLLSLFTSIGVKPRKEMEQKGNKAQTVINYKIVRKKDIVVNKLLAWMGAIGLSEYNGVTSPDYDVYRPLNTEKVEELYYHYYFRNHYFKGDCFKFGRGIMMMRWRTYPEQLKSILVPVPPKEEQIQIANYIEYKEKELAQTIKNIEKSIEKLKEYRQSLIYEAVTGKIDVRDMELD